MTFTICNEIYEDNNCLLYSKHFQLELTVKEECVVHSRLPSCSEQTRESGSALWEAEAFNVIAKALRKLIPN